MYKYKITGLQTILTILTFAYFQTVLTISVTGTRLITLITLPASWTRAPSRHWVTRGPIVTGTRVSTGGAPSAGGTRH